MSSERRRGLVRLGILLASIAGLIVVGLSVVSGSSGGGQSESGQSARARSQPSGPARLTASNRSRLPAAIHGEAVATVTDGLLMIGGEDSGGSTDRVYRLNPQTGHAAVDGSLAQPLHDAAAVTLTSGTLVFGGGNTATIDLVQHLTPGGTAQTVGHLPDAVSDISAVHLAGAAYVLGGFDGQSPSASVLQTTGGQSFTRVARLPTPVRYTAAATTGDKIYALRRASSRTEATPARSRNTTSRPSGRWSPATCPMRVSHASADHPRWHDLPARRTRQRGRRATGSSASIPHGTSSCRPGDSRNPSSTAPPARSAGRGYLLGGLGASDAPLSSVIELR